MEATDAMGITPGHPGAQWRLGFVGFAYPEWSRTFYPRTLPDEDRLAFVAGRTTAVEMNTTFFAIPAVATVRRWASVTPPEFRFCLKTPRDITHGPADPGSTITNPSPTPPGHLLTSASTEMMDRFVATAMALGDRLGAILIQFPASFRSERLKELGAFLDRLPPSVRFAVELRHDSWWMPATTNLLHARNIAWVGTDETPKHLAGKAPSPDRLAFHPRPIVPTADFLYLRFLGKHGQFPDRKREHLDPEARLEWWAKRVMHLLSDHPRITTAYAFFDNDFAGHAPTTLPRFARLLHVGLPGAIEAPEPEPVQPTLFDLR